MPFLTTALGIAAGVSAAGSVATGVMGANAAGNAASTQAQAANHAADLQAQTAQNALNFQEQQYNTTQQELAPFLGVGQGAITTLASLLGTPTTPTGVPAPGSTNTTLQPPGGFQGSNSGTGTVPLSTLNYLQNGGTPPGATPWQRESGAVLRGGTGNPTGPLAGGTAVVASQPATTPTNVGGINYNFPTGGTTALGSLLAPWNQQFQAPTAESAAQTPGYQFQLEQGQQAIENSAASRGGVLSTGEEKALDQYSQGLASTNYQTVYNNALTQYQQAYNQFQNNQSNTYNRLANLAGFGQVAGGQLASAGSTAGGQVGNTLLTAGSQIGQNINNAGAARASGYTGSANALGGAFGNVGNNLGQSVALNSLLQQNNGFNIGDQNAGVMGANGVYVPNIYG